MRRTGLAVLIALGVAAPAQAHYLHIDRAKRAAIHGANFFRGSDEDRVVVTLCRHGQPKVVYCHVMESGPAINALGWDTMDYVIAVVLSRHRPQLVVVGGHTKNWREPF